MIVALSGVDDRRDCIGGAILPKEATNEINHDPLFLPPTTSESNHDKVGESREETRLKVVNLEKVDREQFDEDRGVEADDGKERFGGNQVSESSESLSQVTVMIVMMMMMMIVMMARGDLPCH